MIHNDHQEAAASAKPAVASPMIRKRVVSGRRLGVRRCLHRRRLPHRLLANRFSAGHHQQGRTRAWQIPARAIPRMPRLPAPMRRTEITVAPVSPPGHHLSDAILHELRQSAPIRYACETSRAGARHRLALAIQKDRQCALRAQKSPPIVRQAAREGRQIEPKSVVPPLNATNSLSPSISVPYYRPAANNPRLTSIRLM